MQSLWFQFVLCMIWFFKNDIKLLGDVVADVVCLAKYLGFIFYLNKQDLNNHVILFFSYFAIQTFVESVSEQSYKFKKWCRFAFALDLIEKLFCFA